MNHQNPTLTFYLGQGTDSQARIISRQIPKSPRTWIVTFGSSGDRWPYLNAESWEGTPSPIMVKRFSPRIICSEDVLNPWLDSWACDHLLIDLMPVRCAMYQGAMEAFAALSVRRCMNIHMALTVAHDGERKSFEDFIDCHTNPKDLIRFWIPNQNYDLRYLRCFAKSCIQQSKEKASEGELSNLLCHLHQQPREIGQYP